MLHILYMTCSMSYGISSIYIYKYIYIEEVWGVELSTLKVPSVQGLAWRKGRLVELMAGLE